MSIRLGSPNLVLLGQARPESITIVGRIWRMVPIDDFDYLYENAMESVMALINYLFRINEQGRPTLDNHLRLRDEDDFLLRDEVGVDASATDCHPAEITIGSSFKGKPDLGAHRRKNLPCGVYIPRMARYAAQGHGDFVHQALCAGLVLAPPLLTDQLEVGV
jgi:hypothetical protein